MVYSLFARINPKNLGIFFAVVIAILLALPKGYYISLGLMLLLGLYRLLFDREAFFKNDVLRFSFAAWTIVVIHLVIAFFHQDFNKLGYLINFLLVPILVAGFMSARFKFQHLAIGSALGILVLTIISLVSLDSIPSRFAGYFFNPISFGNITLMMATVCGIAAAQNKLSLKFRFFYLLGFVIGLILTLLSGSKGPWLALPISLAAIGYMVHSSIPNGLNRRILLACLISVFVSVVLTVVEHPRVQKVSVILESYSSKARIQELEIGQKFLKQEGSIAPRVAIWTHFVSTFSTDDLLLGAPRHALWQSQIDTFGEYFPGGYRTPAPHLHNDFLELFAHTGLIGLLPVCYLLWMCIGIFLQSIRDPNDSTRILGVVGLAFICEFLGYGLTNATLHSGPRMAAILVIFSAIVALNLRARMR